MRASFGQLNDVVVERYARVAQCGADFKSVSSGLGRESLTESAMAVNCKGKWHFGELIRRMNLSKIMFQRAVQRTPILSKFDLDLMKLVIAYAFNFIIVNKDKLHITLDDVFTCRFDCEEYVYNLLMYREVYFPETMSTSIYKTSEMDSVDSRYRGSVFLDFAYRTRLSTNITIRNMVNYVYDFSKEPLSFGIVHHVDDIEIENEMQSLILSCVRRENNTRMFGSYVNIRPMHIEHKLQNIACYHLIASNDGDRLGRTQIVDSVLYNGCIRDGLSDILSSDRSLFVHYNEYDDVSHVHRMVVLDTSASWNPPSQITDFSDGNDAMNKLSDDWLNTSNSTTNGSFSIESRVAVHRYVCEMTNRMKDYRKILKGEIGSPYASPRSSVSYERYMYALTSYILMTKCIPQFLYQWYDHVITRNARARLDAVYSVDALFCAEFFVKLTPIGAAWYEFIESEISVFYGANLYYDPGVLSYSVSELRSIVSDRARYVTHLDVLDLEPHYLMKKNILKYLNKYQRYVGYVASGNIGSDVGVNGVTADVSAPLIEKIVLTKEQYVRNLRTRPIYQNSLGLEYNIGCIWSDIALNPLNGDHRPLPLNLKSTDITRIYELNGYTSMFSSLTVCNVNLPQVIYDHCGKQRNKFYGRKSDIAKPCRYCELDFECSDRKSCCSMFKICPICTVFCNKNFGRYKLLAMIATLRHELFNRGPGSLFELMQAPTFLEARVKNNICVWDEHYDTRFTSISYADDDIRIYSDKVWENMGAFEYTTIRHYYTHLKSYSLKSARSESKERRR
jgi:hypothetical protein